MHGRSRRGDEALTGFSVRRRGQKTPHATGDQRVLPSAVCVDDEWIRLCFLCFLLFNFRVPASCSSVESKRQKFESRDLASYGRGI